MRRYESIAIVFVNKGLILIEPRDQGRLISAILRRDEAHAPGEALDRLRYVEPLRFGGGPSHFGDLRFLDHSARLGCLFVMRLVLMMRMVMMLV